MYNFWLLAWTLGGVYIPIKVLRAKNSNFESEGRKDFSPYTISFSMSTLRTCAQKSIVFEIFTKNGFLVYRSMKLPVL